MNSFAFLKAILLLFFIVGVSHAGPAGCQAQCSCLKATVASHVGNIWLVNVDLTSCKGSDMSWAACRNEGCSVVKCDNTVITSPTQKKCDEVMTAQFRFDLSVAGSTTDPVFQMHDGQLQGNKDCPPGAVPLICSGGAGGGCPATYHVCEVTFDDLLVDVTPECTSDAQCAHHSRGVCETASCVLNTCQTTLKSSGQICRDPQGICALPARCDGVSPHCPATNPLRPATYACRVAISPCDETEYCNPSNPSGLCPTDAFKPSTTLCQTTTNPLCDNSYCPGNSPSCPAIQCRQECYEDIDCLPLSHGPCDHVECHENVCVHSFQPNTFVCRPSIDDDCDLPDYCPGNDYQCSENRYKGPEVVCRPAVKNSDLSTCDLPDHCTGNSPHCGENRVLAEDVVCRDVPAGKRCALPAKCDGVSPFCPANPLKSNAEVCREAVYTTDGTTCDQEEKCTGSSPDCPADVFLGSSHVCRPSAGFCDLEERCTGNSRVCPEDAMKPRDTPCVGEGVGENGQHCDVAEKCDGSTATCPRGICPTHPCECANPCANPFHPIPTICGFPDYEKDDEICQKYYRCVNGQRVALYCPLATYADGYGNCVWPDERVCINAVITPVVSYELCVDPQHKLGRLTGDPNDPTKYYICNSLGVVLAQYCPDGSIFSEIDQRCNYGVNVCGIQDYQKDDHYCQKYYRCVHGEILAMYCPLPTYADGHGNCVWPDDRICENVIVVPTPTPGAACFNLCLDPEHQKGKLTGDATDERKFYMCDSLGRVWPRFCPAATHFDFHTQRCEFNTVPNTCNFPDYEKDPFYCQKYYRCVNGARVAMYCPLGTYADGRGNCVWPYDRVCEDIVVIGPGGEEVNYDLCLNPDHKLGKLTPDSFNDRKYYSCDSSGHVRTHFCDIGTYFNFALQRCEFTTVSCDFPNYEIDSHYCQKYYVCDNGRRTAMYCPIPTQPDGHGNCLWPSRTDCVEIPPPTTDVPDTQYYADCVDPIHKLGKLTADPVDRTKFYSCDSSGSVHADYCQAGLYFDFTTQRCDYAGGVSCDFPDFQVDDHFCQKYYRCSNGQRIAMYCPLSTYADGLGGCVLTSSRVCEDITISTDPGSGNSADYSLCVDPDHQLGLLTADPDDNRRYYGCDSSGVVTSYLCAVGQYFHYTLQRCEFVPNSNICVEGAFAAHETTCEQYYICVHGDWSVLSTCALGSYYNPDTQACESNDNFGRTDCTLAHTTPTTHECYYGEVRAHESTCEQYYTCNNGVKVLQLCPNKMKFDDVEKICKIRNCVTRPCVSLFPDACSHGDKMKDALKCSQYQDCVNGDWVKTHCGTSYYDDALGHCNTKETVIAQRPECVTTDESHDADAVEAPDATYVSTQISDADRFPDLARFTAFPAEKKALVKFVTHHFADSRFGCSNYPTWFLAPHPFDCRKYTYCKDGSQWGVDTLEECPSGTSFQAGQWGGNCMTGLPCSGYCSDHTMNPTPYSIGEINNPAGSCAVEGAVLSYLNAEWNKVTLCHGGKDVIVYCCRGLEFNLATQKCEAPLPI